jgi:hypothetical protein
MAALAGSAAPARAAGVLDPVMAGLHWGESVAALRQHLGARAIMLNPPLDFGDADAPLALRRFRLGGYDYTVYFQLDQKGHGLQRVLLDRRPLAANPKIFEAAATAIGTELGRPTACRERAQPSNGYQAMRGYFWRNGTERVRVIFRDTTLEGESGCVESAFYPCGLEAHLIILIDPPDAPGPDCG